MHLECTFKDAFIFLITIMYFIERNLFVTGSLQLCGLYVVVYL